MYEGNKTSHDALRDADKGDEPRSKAKSGPMGRHKRPLEEAGEDSDEEEEEEEEEEGAQGSRRASKKAKVGPSLMQALCQVSHRRKT